MKPLSLLLVLTGVFFVSCTAADETGIIGGGAQEIAEIGSINVPSKPTNPNPSNDNNDETLTSESGNPTDSDITPNNNNPAEPEETPTEPEENPTEPEENPTEPEENPTEPEENPTEPESPTIPTGPAPGGGIGGGDGGVITGGAGGGGVILQPTPCPTGVICVTTTIDAITDDGKCSLREAIRNANNDSQKDNDDCAAGIGDDTISVPEGTYTFALTGTALDYDAATGDLDITKSLTIEGASNGGTIIDAAGKDRIFEFNISSAYTISPLISFTLKHLTLKNGVTTANGGGISVLASSTSVVSLTLEECHVDSNSVTSSIPFGGGIYLKASNSATLSLTMNGGSVSNNSITSTGIARGAGIHIFSNTSISPAPSVTVALNQVSIEGNTATGGGASTSNAAGIYFWGNTLAPNNITIDDSTISENNVVAPSFKGGGMYILNATGTITNSTIYGNTSTALTASSGIGHGGAIYYSGSSLGLYNVSVAKNTVNQFATYKAGGIYSNTGAVIKLNNSFLLDNDAGGVDDDCFGPISSVTHTNIGNSAGCTFTFGDEVWWGNATFIDTYGDHGGPTKVLALSSGSLLIDVFEELNCLNANGDEITTDQRGFLRTDGSCDIGAYEADAFEGEITAEICTNNVDDDFDGGIDCSDADCSSSETDCPDSDHDGDGLANKIDPKNEDDTTWSFIDTTHGITTKNESTSFEYDYYTGKHNIVGIGGHLANAPVDVNGVTDHTKSIGTYDSTDHSTISYGIFVKAAFGTDPSLP